MPSLSISLEMNNTKDVENICDNPPFKILFHLPNEIPSTQSQQVELTGGRMTIIKVSAEVKKT